MKKIFVVTLMIALFLGGCTYLINYEDSYLDMIVINDEDNNEGKNKDNAFVDDEKSILVESGENTLNDVENNVDNKKVVGENIQQNNKENIPSKEAENKDINIINKVKKVIIANSDKETNEEIKEESSNLDSNNKDEVKKIPEVQSENKEDAKKEQVAISEDIIDNVEGSLSLADKAKAIKLIVTKLTPSDIKLLKDMVSGGLTKEEHSKAVEIAYSKYTDEELKLVKSLYKKYMGN